MDFSVKNIIDENGDSVDLRISIMRHVRCVFVEIFDSKDRYFKFLDFEYNYYKELLNNNKTNFKYFIIICNDTPCIQINLFDLDENEKLYLCFKIKFKNNKTLFKYYHKDSYLVLKI